ncbi:coiled-coil domain-containing protein [Spirillospora sp. NPDC048911]|uniref:coiled-coil domain-containing protein n=1 Tax=Spirillospora sp. NPDC048911 TaxID=3364527 RepID=UPI003723D7CD
MDSPTSTRWRRARLALVAVAGVVPLVAGATVTGPSAQADPGDTGRVTKLNKQIEKLDKAYGGDLAKLKDTQHEVKEALQKAKDLKQDLVVARGLVAQIAATQYMTGGADPSVAVLASDDPSTYLNNASLVSHVAQNQAAKVQQIQQLVTQQEKARIEAQGKIKQLEKQIRDLVKEKARVKELLKKYKPESPSSGMNGVTPRMKKVHDILDTEFGPYPTIGCVRSTGDPQDHGTGHACDFMVTTGGRMAGGSAQTLGDRTAAYAIANASKLGVKYVIWRQRIYDMRSPGWNSMSDRGGVTANHYDHVHISVF